MTRHPSQIDKRPTKQEILAYIENSTKLIDKREIARAFHLHGIDRVWLNKTLKEIKKNNPIPIILLTAKGETHNRIEGLELGADDYLGKPFEPKELLLRIKNILNKIQKPVLSDEIYIGSTLVNLKKFHIKTNNRIKKINPQERKILEKMLESPGKVFSRYDIGKIINISKERTIDVMITRLRQKIESYPKNPKYLQTIRGSGYVLWIK